MKPSFAARLALVAGCAAALSMTLSAAAAPMDLIYWKKPGHPKAAIPGTVDTNGNPEATEWRGIEDLAVSPDGSRWVIKARSTAATDHDTGYVFGTELSGSVLVAGGQTMFEGLAAPTSSGGTSGFIDFVPSGFGRFDDNNKLVFALRARTTLAGSTATTDAMRVFTWDGTTFALAFKQGDIYTGLTDTTTSGDETVGNSAGSFHLLNDGRVGSQDSTIGNISSTRRPAIFYNRNSFHQTGITSVSGFGGGPAVVWATLSANGFYSTPSGTSWWATGTAGSPAVGILAVNGAVVIQENSPVGTSGLNNGSVLQVYMASSGQWIARGRDNSSTASTAPDWVVKNGTYLAKTGDPIFPGSTELWGDTFYAVAINSSGKYIIAGRTNNANAGLDDVIVYNGTTVILREGDPVDVDGNGMFDDNTFIGRGTNTNAAFTASTNNAQIAWWLTNDNMLWGLPNLRDGSGVDINVSPAFGNPNALVRITLPRPCPADFNGADGLTVNDIFDFLNAWFTSSPSANFDGVDGVTVQDIFAFLNAWFAGC